MSAVVRMGDIVAGKYRVERVLGKGAMGVVVAATHVELEQRVAIKLMTGDLLERPEMLARFRQEARAVAKLKNAHVARVLDVGELAGGAPFMVMEYLEGQDLAALLSSRGPLPAAEAAGYVLEACEALAEAHARGIVHRDLKPENLYLATMPDGSSLVKLLDFGIAKGPSEPGLRLTSAAAVMGSPLYMPPEQLRSARDVDARSDIWSLGVILYELLAGRTPFGGDDLTELVADVMNNPPPPLGRADLPAGLEAVVVRCLRRERDERYADVASLASALAPFGPPAARASAERASRVLKAAARVPAEPSPRVSIAPIVSSGSLPAAPALLTPPIATRGPDGARSPRALTALLAAFVAVAAGVIGGSTLALRRNDAGPARPAPGARPDLGSGPAAGAAAPPSGAGDALPEAKRAGGAGGAGALPAPQVDTSQGQAPASTTAGPSHMQAPPPQAGPSHMQAQASTPPQAGPSQLQAPTPTVLGASPAQAPTPTALGASPAQAPSAAQVRPSQAQAPSATSGRAPQAPGATSRVRAAASPADTPAPPAPTANPLDMPIK
ncbi:MAG TPA: protein kinase [Polyangiaceae bacterium]|nr:protein kinase [Polyangiaceae bacterium]